MLDFNVGDKVRVLTNFYSKMFGSAPGEIDYPGNTVYITRKTNHGCQLAFDKDHDPNDHCNDSRFFQYGEFEHA